MKNFLLASVIATYSAAALMRGFLTGSAAWEVGLIAFHLAACLALRFLTNATLFSVATAVCSAATEAALDRCGVITPLAISTGTLLELIPALYFAHRFFLTMGD